MNEYRIKEIVGINKFEIQKKEIRHATIENPSKFLKFLIKLGFYNNDEKIYWHSLNVVGNFSGIYYAKQFYSLEEAQKILEKIKSDSLTKIHE